MTADAVPKRRKFCLRLDDGTLISGSSKHTGSESVAIVLLKPQECYERGLLQEAELLRAQSLLCEVHAKLPEAGPLRSVSTCSGAKRSLDSVLEVGQAPSGKRSRSTGMPAGANGYHHDTAAAGRVESPVSVPAAPHAAPPKLPHHAPPKLQHHAPPAAPPPPRPDVSITQFGLSVASKIVKMLGREAFIFTDPVNGKVVTDYYDIIRNPICLNDIRQRLQQGAYRTAAELYEDIYLMLSNCYTYNKIGQPVHILGQRIEKLFNAELRKAGHGHLIRNIKKQPRAAASRGGHRLDDEDEDDDDYKPAKRAGSQRPGAPAKAKSRPPGAGAPRPASKPPGGVARTKSVNSYKAFQPLPEDKQAQLAEALSDEAVLTAKMDGVVEILQRANELGASEDGEVELDLTVLSPQTVWQLYEFIFGPQQPPAGPAQRSGSGFQLEEDSDYQPDDSDEDI